MQRSLAFYRDLLGFEQAGEIKYPFNAVALTSGRTHHEILLIEVGDAPKPHKVHRIGFYHIGIKVGDSLDEPNVDWKKNPAAVVAAIRPLRI